VINCRFLYILQFNPLNAELNPTYHLLSLLGAHHILHVSRIRVNSGKWPTWRTTSSIICLFESSTFFEQHYAHLQEDNYINTTSGIITLKTIEWSKITKISRTHPNLIEVMMCSNYFSNFRPLNCFQSNYTGSCINTDVRLKMSTELLETCRGFK